MRDLWMKSDEMRMGGRPTGNYHLKCKMEKEKMNTKIFLNYLYLDLFFFWGGHVCGSFLRFGWWR